MGMMLQPVHKRFIVRALARYQTPARVAQLVFEEFGIKLTRQSVARYVPDATTKLSQEYRDMYREERAKFLREEAAIGLGNEVYLLQVLQDHLDKELERTKPDVNKILQFVKLGAQIQGGVFRRQVKVEAPAGVPASVEEAIRRVYGEG